MFDGNGEFQCCVIEEKIFSLCKERLTEYMNSFYCDLHATAIPVMIFCFMLCILGTAVCLGEGTLPHSVQRHLQVCCQWTVCTCWRHMG